MYVFYWMFMDKYMYLCGQTGKRWLRYVFMMNCLPGVVCEIRSGNDIDSGLTLILL